MESGRAVLCVCVCASLPCVCVSELDITEAEELMGVQGMSDSARLLQGASGDVMRAPGRRQWRDPLWPRLHGRFRA